MFTRFSILRYVPTLGKLSLILNMPLQTQFPVVGWLVREGSSARLLSRLRLRLWVTSYKLLDPPQARLVNGQKTEVRCELPQLVNS